MKRSKISTNDLRPGDLVVYRAGKSFTSRGTLLMLVRKVEGGTVYGGRLTSDAEFKVKPDTLDPEKIIAVFPAYEIA